MFDCPTAAVSQVPRPAALAARPLGAYLDQRTPDAPAQKPSSDSTSVCRAVTIAGLTESLAALLRRPVAIATLSGQLLACCDPDADDTGGAAGNRPAHSFWRAALRQINARRFVGSGNGPTKTQRIASEESGRSLTTQIVCSIRVNYVPVACVFIWEGPARLSTICVRHAEHTALAAGLYLEQRQKCLDLERGLGTMLLNELLNGQFKSDPIHAALASSINLYLDKEYRVAMLIVHEGRLAPANDTGGAGPGTEQLLALLAENDAPRAVYSTSTGAVFLLPAEADVARFWSSFTHATTSLVVSAPAQGAQAIASSYGDVQSLSADAEPGLLYTHGKLLLPSVLRGDRSAQQAFVESIFGRLSKLRGGKSLVRSLATFARLGFHQARAAKALYVHPNTLRYRIDRISQSLGLDLLDADVRFRVQLASHLWALEVERVGKSESDAATRRPV